MISDSEQSLVEAAQKGHLDSFACLYQRYYSSMAAIAYCMLADRHLAEDAAQQAFVVTCQELSSLKRKDKFAGWLAGICRNVARQMYKSKGSVVAMYRKDKNTVVLYDPKDKCFTIGSVGKFLQSLAEQKLIIDEDIGYREKPAHRVRWLMANQDIFVDPDTFLPIAGAGLEMSYEKPPEGTFEITIPDNYILIDKRPGAKPVNEPVWFKEYEAADENFHKAKQAMSEGRFEDAASLFEHVVLQQPRRNWAWYWLGRTHYQLGHCDLAIYEFTKTLEIVGS